jgi:hypothetical protein
VHTHRLGVPSNGPPPRDLRPDRDSDTHDGDASATRRLLVTPAWPEVAVPPIALWDA